MRLSGGVLGELTRIAALLRPLLQQLEALAAPPGSLTMKAGEAAR